MKAFLAIAKALSDRNRVRTLMFLRDGELCVCQIIEMLGLAPSTVSKHMAVLYQAGLVEMRKAGRWVYYRLADEGGDPCSLAAMRWVLGSLEGNEQIAQDAERLKVVRKADKDDLCDHYRS